MQMQSGTSVASHGNLISDASNNNLLLTPSTSLNDLIETKHVEILKADCNTSIIMSGSSFVKPASNDQIDDNNDESDTADYYADVEIEDMQFNQENETYYYPCPCGDKFFITKVSTFGC
jgi:hypothetical protein